MGSCGEKNCRNFHFYRFFFFQSKPFFVRRRSLENDRNLFLVFCIKDLWQEKRRLGDFISLAYVLSLIVNSYAAPASSDEKKLNTMSTSCVVLNKDFMNDWHHHYHHHIARWQRSRKFVRGDKIVSFRWIAQEESSFRIFIGVFLMIISARDSSFFVDLVSNSSGLRVSTTILGIFSFTFLAPSLKIFDLFYAH